MTPTHTQDKLLWVYSLYCMLLHFSLSCPKNVLFKLGEVIRNLPVTKAVLCRISTGWLHSFWKHVTQRTQGQKFTSCRCCPRNLGVQTPSAAGHHSYLTCRFFTIACNTLFYIYLGGFWQWDFDKTFKWHQQLNILQINIHNGTVGI